MTNSRIASAFLAPALAAILAIACSSSDNNGGGTTVGGAGGTSNSAKGGSGPQVVTGDAACKDALARGTECNGKTDAAQEKEFLEACKSFTSACTKCLIDAECDKQIDCLTGDACKAATGGTGGTSSGKGGTGGTSSGKGGTSSGKGGTGGTGSTDPETCIADCADANMAGSDFYNEAFIAECACNAGAKCSSDCADGCNGGEPSEACNACLDGITGSDKCIAAANTACSKDAGCGELIACAQGCGSGGGSGGSGGGSGGQACANECAKNNQAGVAAYNADAMGLTKCLCEGTSCKSTCADSPICTSGEPQASQECISCQDNCFSTCQADADCKALYECVQGCN